MCAIAVCLLLLCILVASVCCYRQFQQTGITGTIQPGLAALTKLTMLNLALNPMSGTIPVSLQNLVNLDTMCAIVHVFKCFSSCLFTSLLSPLI